MYCFKCPINLFSFIDAIDEFKNRIREYQHYPFLKNMIDDKITVTPMSKFIAARLAESGLANKVKNDINRPSRSVSSK